MGVCRAEGIEGGLAGRPWTLGVLNRTEKVAYIRGSDEEQK